MTRTAMHPGLTILTIVTFCCLQGCSPSAETPGNQQPIETGERPRKQQPLPADPKRTGAQTALEATPQNAPVPSPAPDLRPITSTAQPVEIRDPTQPNEKRTINIPKEYLKQETWPQISSERPADMIVGTEKWRAMSPEERQREAVKAFQKTSQ